MIGRIEKDVGRKCQKSFGVRLMQKSRAFEREGGGGGGRVGGVEKDRQSQKNGKEKDKSENLEEDKVETDSKRREW